MDSLKNNFLKTIDNHQGIIKSLCNVYYSDFEDQRDARQDIILQLWKSFPSFRGESNISTWIYKVGLNTILSKIKKENRRPDEESLNHLHENKPVTFLNNDDDLQLLTQIIQSLKDLDKAVVILYLEGYKNTEIAQLIGLTPSNISTRMNRIKTTLKSKYKISHHDYK